ncbi:hypothetical protein SODALDRAFT_331809 [Sodiomyces alkalinus F11]|uniref:Uncharacterized protein n=1 Tax=Sodiomyces alkalinus (strain CBS 110278 / VKM F-3762 / F11) TaxID=1314773 RepID=A0A3N2PYU8_SODAK|nr:hypothetical protein SODALDRAFT_331809 [Sodiomyces alkalinus F11]ROT39701.1 hypothetical protein SODALDRAFT_331809 [Sodiomyces alkalinus F11]
MTTNPKPGRKSVPVTLERPPLYQGHGSYTQEPRSSGDMEFVLPRSATKSTLNTVDTMKVNSAALPQPFLSPDIIMKWAKSKP